MLTKNSAKLLRSYKVQAFSKVDAFIRKEIQLCFAVDAELKLNP